jgi:hypothetical protein
MNVSNPPSVFADLRRLLMPWAFALLLPVPVLLTGADTNGADIGTLYLAVGAAWLATEAFRPGSQPEKVGGWRTRISALLICLGVNAAIFTVLGLAAGVTPNIPLPMMAVFGVSPALGLVPWLTLRLRQPYGAIVLGAMIVGLIKIGACVVARIVYGPDYIALGYVSADWQTAKLMISLMWAGTLLVSALALVACHRRFALRAEHENQIE